MSDSNFRPTRREPPTLMNHPPFHCTNNSTPSLNMLPVAQLLASAHLDHPSFVNFLTKTRGTLVADLLYARLSPKCALNTPSFPVQRPEVVSDTVQLFQHYVRPRASRPRRVHFTQLKRT